MGREPPEGSNGQGAAAGEPWSGRHRQGAIGGEPHTGSCGQGGCVKAGMEWEGSRFG